MKKILNFLYIELILPIRNQWIIRKQIRALNMVKKYALHLSMMNNGRKYIVLTNHKGDYEAICKDDWKLWRLPRRGRLDRNLTWEQLCREAKAIIQYKER